MMVNVGCRNLSVRIRVVFNADMVNLEILCVITKAFESICSFEA